MNLPAVPDIDRAIYEKSLPDFARAAWHVVEPTTPLIWSWHLDAISEHLQAVSAGQIRNLIINVPPGHMKSLQTSVFWPCWEWTTRPETRWLFASYSANLSERDSKKCRRLIESEWYSSLWGHRFRLRDDQNTSGKFENDKTGFRIATSVSGMGTGERANRVVVDDPHNVKERESHAKRNAVLDWWDNAFSNRLCDYQKDVRVLIMQRVHERDLVGHILARGGFELLCLPTEYEPARRCVTSLGWQDPRTTEGELLFPQRFGPEEVMEAQQTLGPMGYAGQHQQRPNPAGGGRFKSSYFRHFKIVGKPLWERPGGEGNIYHLDNGRQQWAVRDQDCRRFAVMDPAGTDKQQNAKACYSVLQCWAITPSYEMLLLDQWREQVETPDAVDAAVRKCREWEVESLAVEKDGIGLGIVQSIKRRNIPVVGIKARGSKEARTETAEIFMAAGKIHFPVDAPFLFDLEQELLLCPNGDDWDQIDALSHAAILLQKRGGGAPVRPEHVADPVMNDQIHNAAQAEKLADAEDPRPGKQIDAESHGDAPLDDPEVRAFLEGNS